MATILTKVPLTASGNILLVATAQGAGPDGWRVVFNGSTWVGSVVLKANMAAPGQAASLTSIAYLTASTGATNTAGTAITTSGDFIISPANCVYDLYAVYTHTSGSCAVTVLTEDSASGGGGGGGATTAAEVDGSASQNTFGSAVPYTGAYIFPGALTSTGNFTVGSSKFTIAAATGNTVVAGTLKGNDTTDSNSISTGSLVTAGGLGVAKAIFGGTTLNIAGISTFANEITFSTAVGVDTFSIAKNGTYGLGIRGGAGSSYDFALVSANGTPIVVNPTGTTITGVLGAFSVTGTSTLTGVVGVGGAAVSASTALNTPASTTAISSLRIAHGAAPTAPVNGDVWSTTTGLFIQIDGVTKTVTLT